MTFKSLKDAALAVEALTAEVERLKDLLATHEHESAPQEPTHTAAPTRRGVTCAKCTGKNHANPVKHASAAEVRACFAAA